MRNRVLLLTQWFDPEPTFKGLVFARELVKKGFEVEVVTGFPNYPGGKLYPGYKLKHLQREVIDGVHVTRVPLYPNHDQSAIKRILNYASFAASSLIYCLFFARRPDVIYSYHPPLTIGITAAILRLLRGIPVVYDIQDMWPDTLKATGMLNNKRLLDFINLLCKWVYKKVDKIVVLSPGFKKILLNRGVTENKLDVIYNWADEDSLNSPRHKISKLDSFSDSKFNILFAGNMGKAQALYSVLDAAKILQDRGSRVCWVMLGGGVEVGNLKRKAQELNLGNLVFLPSVPMSEVGAYLSSADVLLVHLRKDPLFEITIPSKTQAYMAVGKPILMGVNGDAADLVRSAKCGLLAESENADALADAAEAMANLKKSELAIMSENAKKYYKEKLSLKVGAEQFSQIFKNLIKKH